MTPQIAKDVTYIPFDEATKPRDGEVLTNRWWVVHPEMGLAVFRRHSPQCNSDRRLPESLIARRYPGHESRFFEIVYIGQRRHGFEVVFTGRDTSAT